MHFELALTELNTKWKKNRIAQNPLLKMFAMETTLFFEHNSCAAFFFSSLSISIEKCRFFSPIDASILTSRMNFEGYFSVYCKTFVNRKAWSYWYRRARLIVTEPQLEISSKRIHFNTRTRQNSLYDGLTRYECFHFVECFHHLRLLSSLKCNRFDGLKRLNRWLENESGESDILLGACERTQQIGKKV